MDLHHPVRLRDRDLDSAEHHDPNRLSELRVQSGDPDNAARHSTIRGVHDKSLPTVLRGFSSGIGFHAYQLYRLAETPELGATVFYRAYGASHYLAIGWARHPVQHVLIHARPIFSRRHSRRTGHGIVLYCYCHLQRDLFLGL